MMRMVAGEPTAAAYFATISPKGYDEYGSGILQFPSNVNGHFGTGVHVSLKNDVWIYGDAGHIEVRGPWIVGEESRVILKQHGKDAEEFNFFDGYHLYAREADAVAESLAEGMKERTLPPFIGIRIKPLNEELRVRSMRTLEIVLRETIGRAGTLPENFVITVPKIVILEQVDFMVAELGRMERALGIARGTLKFEVMVETPQVVLGAEGRSLLPRIPAVSGGRLTGAHFGTYDYTAGVNITAAHQRMRHPACDFAKHVMQVSLAGTGVWLSDGSTTVMPVPIHRAAPGELLSAQQDDENCASVHAAWKLHFDDIYIGSFAFDGEKSPSSRYVFLTSIESNR